MPATFGHLTQPLKRSRGRRLPRGDINGRRSRYPLTSLVQEPHEREAGHEADGPPEHEERDVPAREAVGLARRVLDGAPGVPDQALHEPQQRKEQQHEPAAPVHPPGTRGCRGQRRRRRRRLPPASPSSPRRRPEPGSQQRLPLLLAAPARAHYDARPAGSLPSADTVREGGTRDCFGRPRPRGRVAAPAPREPAPVREAGQVRWARRGLGCGAGLASRRAMERKPRRKREWTRCPRAGIGRNWEGREERR